MSKSSSMSKSATTRSDVTVGDVLDELMESLHADGVPDAGIEARDIVAALVDKRRFWPSMHREVAVDDALRGRARDAFEKRRQGAPLAYAVGRACFRHLTLTVDERVLIPRPETEQLVDLVLDETRAARGGIAIDIGTGSGAIAIALASEGNFEAVYATDVSRDALDVARENAKQLRESLRAPVYLHHGSLFRPLPPLHARVIVSNPPYIALAEAATLPAGVRDWEPAAALFSGSDGMSATLALLRAAPDVLADGGILALEVDARRASLVADAASRDARFEVVSVRLDLTGRERFVLARRKERKRG
jgi:release factor glutamine methyltransferase